MGAKKKASKEGGQRTRWRVRGARRREGKAGWRP